MNNGRVLPSSCVVIGVGNADRGDDGVGLAVLERLRTLLPAGVLAIGGEAEPSRLIDAWHGSEAAFVVDATCSGGIPGTLHRYDARDHALPVRVLRSSTHAFGVGETIELARALGRLPAYITVYGVEGAQFDAGASLSTRVEAAVPAAADALLADLARLTDDSPRSA